jgi:hypothetical protein
MSEAVISQGQVVRVDRCRLGVGPAAWDHGAAHGPAIASHWQAMAARNPSYFNGVIHVLVDHAVADGQFTGTFARTDFATFLHWRSETRSRDRARDCFGCAILRAADGALLLGIQAAGNLNAGRAYCPGGFIDPLDIGADGVIDIDGSIVREIGEETGLTLADLTRTPGYILVAAGMSIAIGVEYRSALPAEALRAAMLRHLASEAAPELADIMIVRTAADLDGVPTSGYVPPLVAALL